MSFGWSKKRKNFDEVVTQLEDKINNYTTIYEQLTDPKYDGGVINDVFKFYEELNIKQVEIDEGTANVEMLTESKWKKDNNLDSIYGLKKTFYETLDTLYTKEGKVGRSQDLKQLLKDSKEFLENDVDPRTYSNSSEGVSENDDGQRTYRNSRGGGVTGTQSQDGGRKNNTISENVGNNYLRDLFFRETSERFKYILKFLKDDPKNVTKLKLTCRSTVSEDGDTNEYFKKPSLYGKNVRKDFNEINPITFISFKIEIDGLFKPKQTSAVAPRDRLANEEKGNSDTTKALTMTDSIKGGTHNVLRETTKNALGVTVGKSLSKNEILFPFIVRRKIMPFTAVVGHIEYPLTNKGVFDIRSKGKIQVKEYAMYEYNRLSDETEIDDKMKNIIEPLKVNVAVSDESDTIPENLVLPYRQDHLKEDTAYGDIFVTINRHYSEDGVSKAKVPFHWNYHYPNEADSGKLKDTSKESDLLESFKKPLGGDQDAYDNIMAVRPNIEGFVYFKDSTEEGDTNEEGDEIISKDNVKIFNFYKFVSNLNIAQDLKTDLTDEKIKTYFRSIYNLKMCADKIENNNWGKTDLICLNEEGFDTTNNDSNIPLLYHNSFGIFGETPYRIRTQKPLKIDEGEKDSYGNIKHYDLYHNYYQMIPWFDKIGFTDDRITRIPYSLKATMTKMKKNIFKRMGLNKIPLLKGKPNYPKAYILVYNFFNEMIYRIDIEEFIKQYKMQREYTTNHNNAITEDGNIRIKKGGGEYLKNYEEVIDRKVESNKSTTVQPHLGKELELKFTNKKKNKQDNKIEEKAKEELKKQQNPGYEEKKKKSKEELNEELQETRRKQIMPNVILNKSTLTQYSKEIEGVDWGPERYRLDMKRRFTTAEQKRLGKKFSKLKRGEIVKSKKILFKDVGNLDIKTNETKEQRLRDEFKNSLLDFFELINLQNVNFEFISIQELLKSETTKSEKNDEKQKEDSNLQANCVKTNTELFNELHYKKKKQRVKQVIADKHNELDKNPDDILLHETLSDEIDFLNTLIEDPKVDDNNSIKTEENKKKAYALLNDYTAREDLILTDEELKELNVEFEEERKKIGRDSECIKYGTYIPKKFDSTAYDFNMHSDLGLKSNPINKQKLAEMDKSTRDREETDYINESGKQFATYDNSKFGLVVSKWQNKDNFTLSIFDIEIVTGLDDSLGVDVLYKIIYDETKTYEEVEEELISEKTPTDLEDQGENPFEEFSQIAGGGGENKTCVYGEEWCLKLNRADGTDGEEKPKLIYCNDFMNRLSLTDTQINMSTVREKLKKSAEKIKKISKGNCGDEETDANEKQKDDSEEKKETTEKDYNIESLNDEKLSDLILILARTIKIEEFVKLNKRDLNVSIGRLLNRVKYQDKMKPASAVQTKERYKSLDSFRGGGGKSMKTLKQINNIKNIITSFTFSPKLRGGGSLLDGNEMIDFMTKVVPCDNVKLDLLMKEYAKNVIENFYTKTEMETEFDKLLKIYENCGVVDDSQSGGGILPTLSGIKAGAAAVKAAPGRAAAVAIAAPGNAARAYGNTKRSMKDNAISTPYLPSGNGPEIEQYHYSPIMPCPKGIPETLCAFSSGLLPKGIVDGVPYAKTGVKNSRQALNTHGVERATEENINPHNIPYILNEPKWDNYKQLMTYNLVWPMLNKSDLKAQETIQKSFSNPELLNSDVIKKHKKGQTKEILHSDVRARDATQFNFTRSPKGNYTPVQYDEGRLRKLANNIVYANGQNNYLMPKTDNTTRYGQYGTGNLF